MEVFKPGSRDVLIAFGCYISLVSFNLLVHSFFSLLQFIWLETSLQFCQFTHSFPLPPFFVMKMFPS